MRWNVNRLEKHLQLVKNISQRNYVDSMYYDLVCDKYVESLWLFGLR